jgi:GMP synthase (glutamine-hydrolysing)
MRRVLVVKTGRTLASLLARRGDSDAWIAAAMGMDPASLDVVPVFEGAALPDPGDVAGVVITGSPAMVSDRAPWSVRTAAWLERAVADQTPVFGICYGHQLLADALGGRAGPNPRGREMGTVEVELLPEAAGDPLFSATPPRIRAHTTHLETVLELPAGARVLARNAADRYHAVAFAPRAWGVQFHPEFDADVMRTYLTERREVLRSEGRDPDALIGDTMECEESTALLRRFAELVADAREARPGERRRRAQ